MMNHFQNVVVENFGVLLVDFVSVKRRYSIMTPAQALMHADGLPLAYLISVEERAALQVGRTNLASTRNFNFETKKVSEYVLPPQPIKESKPNKTKYAKQDTRGMRWCPRRNKIIPDNFQTTATSQEEETIMKWKITCYNEANEVLPRGSTSVPVDTGQVELFAKMGAAFHRCATGSVNKITVTTDDDQGEIIRTWE